MIKIIILKAIGGIIKRIMNNNYNKYLEFFMENNIILNEGLLDKLRIFKKQNNEENQNINKNNKENDTQNHYYISELKKFIKNGKLDGELDGSGSTRTILYILKDCNVPEKSTVTLILKNNKPENILRYTGNNILDKDKNTLKQLLGEELKATIIGSDDDMIAFISPKDKKCYECFFNYNKLDIKQSSIYSLANDFFKDYIDYDDEFVNMCKNIIKNK